MGWSETIFRFIGLARYNSITPSLTSGDTCEPQCDQNGRLLVSLTAITTLWQDSGAAVAERVVKASAGKIHQIFGRNTGGADRYIFIFNHATSGGSRPANGSTAQIFVPIKVKAGEHFSIDLTRARSFETGLYWGVSSTDGSFTYDSGGAFAVCAEYE